MYDKVLQMYLNTFCKYWNIYLKGKNNVIKCSAVKYLQLIVNWVIDTILKEASMSASTSLALIMQL